MKAMVYRRYGSPDNLHLEEVKKPVPGDNQLLVKVKASSVNALDWHFLRGKPILVRLQYGLLRPKVKVLGYDMAGIVEDIGKDVTQFKPGDEVFGGLGFGLGGFAEYACINEKGFVARKPGNISFEQAAAVPAAAVTALIGIQDRGMARSGQSVLINGSTGGVGTFAVQIAKALGMEVTGVCSTRKKDMVRSLGADYVIDYTRDDFSKIGRYYDLLLDNVGNRNVTDMLHVIRPGGTCVIVGFTGIGNMLRQSIFGPLRSKAQGIRWDKPASGEPSLDHANYLKELLETGMVVPLIEKQYSLENLPDALRHIETGHAKAKIVIKI